MESIQLQPTLEQMISSLGVEPLCFSYTNDSEEFELIDDNFADQFLNPIPSDDEPRRVNTAAAQELFLDLNGHEVKHEDRWLSIDQFNAHVQGAPLSPIVIDEASPKNTQELLNEFDAVYNAVGSSLTPPASPPHDTTQAKISEEDASIFYVLEGEEVDAEMLLEDSCSLTSEESNDFFDELVRSHSSCIPDDTSVQSNASSPRSDASSPRSDSSFDVSGFDEEEWTPALEPMPLKRKKRPYGRPVEEKKVRKKEQNKNAATRYRQKKKQQLDVILREEDELKAVHMQLKTKFDDRKREINYLKKLMKEILIAKGFQI